MGLPYAEVIGDPIAQSRSPIIHRYWLDRLGLDGDFRTCLVPPADLGSYFRERRSDSDWRGCSVTIPHKQSAIALVDSLDPGVADVGAINCVYRKDGGLVGRNTDVDGVAAALESSPVAGAKAVLIGAGGGARAALRHLLDRGAERVVILVRDPVKTEALGEWGEGRIQIAPIDACQEAMEGARIMVNASPMGMAGAHPMPESLLACVAAHAQGATLFDMVYHPLETAFLAAGRANKGHAVDGLVMLVGQARAAFELFFGHPPPAGSDSALRDLLAT